MSELTPLNAFPFPTEFEEPYFATMRGYFTATDAADWALSENDNTTWDGGGNIAWDATSGILTWQTPIELKTHTTAFKAIIPGPPFPGGEVTLQDGEVAFFQMPRLLTKDTNVTLRVGPTTFLPGTRLHDLKLFAARRGTTVFFADGKSLKDGEVDFLFGDGVSTGPKPHEHQPLKIIEPPFATNILDLDIASFSPSVLRRLKLYKNGELITEPADYSLNLGSGIVTLVIASVPGDRFIACMETNPTAATPGPHQHLTPRIIEPIAGTTVMDMLVTSLDCPALTQIKFYRNGLLQAEPADYSLDLTTGLVTIVVPSIGGERFVACREVV